MKKFFIMFSIVIFMFVNGFAEIISHSLSYDSSDLKFSRLNEFDIITMKNLDVTDQVGAPQLPAQLLHFYIPLDFKVEKIEIVKLEKKVLTGEFNILPVQKPEILSSPQAKYNKIELTKPDELIYRSNSYYPAQIIEYKESGFSGGHQIVSFLVYPIQYLPIEQKVVFYSTIEFNIHLEPSNLQAVTNKTISKSHLDAVIKSFVQNPDAIKSTAENLKTNQFNAEVHYLIITSTAYVNNFQPLAGWKHKKGVPTRIVAVDSIYSNYDGRDKAEKVRNFIKYAHDNWGAIWVLLGGDTQIVPHRTAFAMDCRYGADPQENNIPCDLYFADLDGNWDFNNNGIYGEVADSVDLYPEVFVGRAPADNSDEINSFVNKILAYEKTPPSGYQHNMLFAAELLWSSPYTNTGIGKDMIEAEFLPSNFYHITKLYEDLGNESRSSVIEALNKGQLIFNHDGHANTTVMSVGPNSSDVLRPTDMVNLTNFSKYTICFSIGCYPAAFERDCIAESFVNNPRAGGIAFIGNSRYGWGSPGNPGFGYSDRFDNKFFKFLFQDQNYSIGQALALAKMFHVPYARQENVYRWCMYEINLLGDPEMPVWTDVPQTLTVSYPAVIPTSESQVTITVSHDGKPVANAKVCLSQPDDIYVFGKTASNGQISFFINPIDASTDINVTVTAPNFLPVEGSIDVSSNQAYIATTKWSIVDDNGNGDGLLNPGETINLNVTFKNYGNQPANDLTATLSSDDSVVSIENGSIQLGNIPALDSIFYEKAYTLTLDSNRQNGQIIPFDLQITDNGTQNWKEILPLTVTTPIISFYGAHVNDLNGGNGNGIPEPGETVKLIVSMTNNGFAPAKVTNSPLLTTPDDFLTISSGQGFLNCTIQPGQIEADSFTVVISDSCPIPRFAKFNLKIDTDNNHSFPITFKLSIGQLGFTDDIELDTGDWNVLATAANLWHVSKLRSHSPTHSWYCGNETNRTYSDNNQSILFSPHFYLGANAKLSFWLWFDVAIYSKDRYIGDGLYIEVYDGSQWHTLDFIGTGGALEPILMGSDWCQYTYDLSSFPIGGNGQLRFKFISDPFWSDQKPESPEGIYLDDVKVSYDLSTDVQKKAKPIIPDKYVLKQNYPNPFNQSTIFEYQIAGNDLQHVQLRVFNILGQEVKTLVDQKQSGGIHLIRWNGLDNRGLAVASGIYIYRLHAGEFKEVRKLVILR